MGDAIKPLKIFLSYAQADVMSMRALYRYLRDKGFDVWFDEESSTAGQTWQQEIKRELNRSDVIIPCFSQTVRGKDGVLQEEFKFSLEQMLKIPKEQVVIIPVRLQVCSKPVLFNSYNWVDLFQRDGPDRLMRALKMRAEELGRAPVQAHEEKSAKTPDLSAIIRDNAHGNVFIMGDHNVVHQKQADVEKSKNDGLEQKKATVEMVSGLKPEGEKKPNDKIKNRQWVWLPILAFVIAVFAVAAFLKPVFPATSSTSTSVNEESLMQIQAADTPTFFPTQTQPLATLTTSPTATVFVATSTPTFIPSQTSTLVATPINIQISEKDGMRLHHVPAGPFMMGNDLAGSDAKPVHQVTLDSFWIDETEVTNHMYALCVAEGACKLPSNLSSPTHPDYYLNSLYANYPVTHLFWKDASAYCKWAGRTLPSEAQWEKAARGAFDLPYTYPWGNNPPSDSLLNYNKHLGDTSEVGSYPDGVSPYGALDMAGNVWEWVNDWYGPKYYSVSPSTNPTGPSFGNAYGLRGGSWTSDKYGAGMRSYYRNSGGTGYINIDVGFRCALVAP